MSVIAMQCTPIEITAVAEESANIELETISAEPGESIYLDLTISNNPGIIAVSVTLEYDSSCLSLKSVDDGALFSGASFTPSGNMSVIPFRVMWEDGLSKENYTDNGTLATFHFEVLDTAEYGTYEIKVAVENQNTFDVNLDEVEIASSNGSVIIEDSSVETETTTEITTETITETTTETFEEIETEITTARTYIAYVSELRDMAKKDYKSRTGIYPDNAVSEFKSNGFFNISLYDEDGNLLDIYTIDPYSGVGISESSYGIELPQTENNSVKTIAGTVSALALMISGAFAMTKSGIISRKCKDEDNE